MLERFADLEHGTRIVSGLGFALVTDDEASVVSQLTWFPDAGSLIREYLEAVRVPRLAEVRRFAPNPDPAPAPTVRLRLIPAGTSRRDDPRSAGDELRQSTRARGALARPLAAVPRTNGAAIGR